MICPTDSSIPTNFFKAKLLVKLIVWLTVNLDIGVDEVVERRAILLRRQCDVAPSGKLHSISIYAAEEVVLFSFAFHASEMSTGTQPLFGA